MKSLREITSLLLLLLIWTLSNFSVSVLSSEQASLKGSVEWANVRDSSYEEALSKGTILVLDLATVLEMALDKNLDIEVQEYVIKKAKDNLIGSSSKFLPSVSFSQTLSRREGSIQLFGNQTIPISIKSVQPQIYSSFALFRGGKVLFGWLSSKKQLDAEKTNLDSTKQITLQQVAATYYGLQRFKAELESELVRFEQAELNLKERKIAKELGADIGLSVLLAQQEVDQTTARIEELKGSLYIESGKLNQLLNLPQDVLIIPATGIDENSLVAWKTHPDVLSLIAIAKSKSPELQSLKLYQDSARAQQLQSVSAFLPTLEISSVTAWVGPNFHNLSQFNQYMLVGQYDVLQNLGGAALSNYLLAKHSKDELGAQLQRNAKQLENSVNESYLRLDSGRRVFLANKSSLKYSEEAYKQAIARLKAEVGTPYEVKVSQTELERARANYFDSLVKYKVAQVNLIKVLGMATPQNLVKGVEL